jgi:hypothetical protein
VGTVTWKILLYHIFLYPIVHSFRPFWAAMNAITGSAGFVWMQMVKFVDDKVRNKLSNLEGWHPEYKNYTHLERTAYACSGLVCGGGAALIGFGYGLFAQSTTKTFDANASDEDIEAFCISPAAMAFSAIDIKMNSNVTKRTLVAISRCFWLTKVVITNCSNMDGESLTLLPVDRATHLALM